ncbi:murein biosynthesis integral membrane protein MurJ [Acuticoccus sp. M5D2P5]|uniref:murein biosynthesis integral membrane protein MurJ n=1 Tax=Acuticoccus kalidii TaxID=2910977 RepID=UPI001F4164A1|nr:murein biosynthesis integral membrane protein MurJ [Acuticoccus kalidii]MCF3933960.1 murein biosynthesis integral membrane protein MurJ [Acuticoccus kalidii]
MQLLRNFATVGAFTAASRVLGFARDILVAALLGAGPVADAFFVAFKLPNLFRRLFAEGAFNSAFVPLFARVRAEEGETGAETFASSVLSWLLIVLLVLTTIAELFTPFFIFVLAPGFAADSKVDLAVLFTRICFPYLMAMSLVAFLSGILNTLDRFAAAAFAPVLLNIVMISALGFAAFAGMDQENAGYVLAWGVFAAGLAQVVLLAVAVRRIGVRLRLPRPRPSPRLKRLLILGLPGVAAGGITQINIVVGTIIASFWPAAVSHLYYADRLYQLPLGIVGIALGVALLPDLSRRLRNGDVGGALWTQNRAFEFALMLTLPAAAALIVVPLEIVVTLFERGAFDREDAALTAAAVAAYGFGLPAFVLIKVFSPAYFAREDTATPMLYAGISMLVNVGGSIVLARLLAPQGLPHVGIAAATSIAGWVNAILLFVGLLRRGDFKPDPLLWSRALGFLAASLALMIGAVLIARGLDGWFFSAGLLQAVAALAILVGGSALIFALVCEMSGAIGVRDVMRALRRR